MLETPPHRLEAARRIAQRLAAAQSIAVATHVGGDGDGWGSAAAVAHHFGTRGTDVRLLTSSPFPGSLEFLLPSGAELLTPGPSGIEALETAEIQLVVDVSEPSRLAEFALHYDRERTIVIDHHALTSQPIEASLTFVDSRAAATVELVYDVIAQTGEKLSLETARALYVGLVTDTGSFRYSNTSPHTHRLAATLIEAGANPETLYRPLFANQSAAELATLRAVLDGIEHDPAHGLTWASLAADVDQRFGGLDEYEGIIEHVRNLSGTEVAILFRQLPGGEIKVSFRSSGATNIGSLARSFGGGGHEKAAGATLTGELPEVIEEVLAACRALLAGGIPRS